MKSLQKLRLLKWKTISLVLSLQLCGIFLLAQVSINGKVTDPEGKGIPGISVAIRNTSFGVATDVRGIYSMSTDLRAGTYTLEFSGVGFKSTTKTLQITSSSSYTADAQLAADALNMEEVVVTGTSLGTTRRQLGSYVSTVK